MPIELQKMFWFSELFGDMHKGLPRVQGPGFMCIGARSPVAASMCLTIIHTSLSKV